MCLCAVSGQDDDRDRPYEAFATFQFFLFVVYFTFFVALSVSTTISGSRATRQWCRVAP